MYAHLYIYYFLNLLTRSAEIKRKTNRVYCWFFLLHHGERLLIPQSVR